MARPDVLRWLIRELQALQSEPDVSLVARHIHAYLQSLPQVRFNGSQGMLVVFRTPGLQRFQVVKS